MYVDMLEGWREANGYGAVQPSRVHTAWNASVLVAHTVIVWHRLEHVTFLAHSWGAFLAAHYASRYPQRVDHLMLMSPAGCCTVMPFNTFTAGISFKWLTPQRFAGMVSVVRGENTQRAGGA